MISRKPSIDIEQHLKQIYEFYARGERIKANKHLSQIYKKYPKNTNIIKTYVKFSAEDNDLEKAIQFANILLIDEPENFGYVVNLAQWSMRIGKLKKAIAYYQEYIDLVGNNPNAYFNQGILYRHNGEYNKAIHALEKASVHNYQPIVDVHLEMALTHEMFRHEDLAISSLKQLLKLSPNHLIAKFNLATLYQSAGRKEEAEIYFKEVLNQDPTFTESLVRLAYLNKQKPEKSDVIRKMKRRIRSSQLKPKELESLSYALGKAHDDVEDYESAYNYYKEANTLNLKRIGPYNSAKLDKYIAKTIAHVNKQWLEPEDDSKGFEPIFIIGHFRSGSTLVEQIISGHSNVESLGEIDFFLKYYNENDIYSKSQKLAYKMLGTEYEALVSTMSKSSKRATDKRPENILVMGLIKKLYPKAKFIHTKRNLDDNGLSVYFNQLNDLSTFSTSQESFLAYDKQCQELMEHWKLLFKEDIYEVQYESLVETPEEISKEIITFLGLEWEQDCIEFKERKNFVRTASADQVRHGIYSSSIGRCKNYHKFM